MSGWTKGPWRPDRGTSAIIRGISAAGKVIVRWNGIGAPTTAEGQANARLIAAAPDLAEAAEVALERMLQPLDDLDMSASAQAYRQVRAALLKAKGE